MKNVKENQEKRFSYYTVTLLPNTFFFAEFSIHTLSVRLSTSFSLYCNLFLAFISYISRGGKRKGKRNQRKITKKKTVLQLRALFTRKLRGTDVKIIPFSRIRKYIGIVPRLHFNCRYVRYRYSVDRNSTSTSTSTANRKGFQKCTTILVKSTLEDIRHEKL